MSRGSSGGVSVLSFRYLLTVLLSQTKSNDQEGTDELLATLPYSQPLSRPLPLVADLGRLTPASRTCANARVSSLSQLRVDRNQS